MGTWEVVLSDGKTTRKNTARLIVSALYTPVPTNVGVMGYSRGARSRLTLYNITDLCTELPCSPELNLIEILWRKIKYAWLPFSAYWCLNALIAALEDILRKFETEYRMNFAQALTRDM